MAAGEVIKQYTAFTAEEQEAYEKLPAMQRKYIDLRGAGYGKREAYEMAGYGQKNAKQAAWVMESRNALIPQLAEKLQNERRLQDLGVPDSKINKTINALARQEGVERALETIENADGETARRIQFYRDIMNGTIKTVKRVTTKGADGKVKSVKIEEVEDVGAKMTARKELDKILGLTRLPSIDNFKVGGITVNIVDASKREELEDSRNQVQFEIKDVETIDGERAIVVSDRVNVDKGDGEADE